MEQMASEALEVVVAFEVVHDDVHEDVLEEDVHDVLEENVHDEMMKRLFLEQ